MKKKNKKKSIKIKKKSQKSRKRKKHKKRKKVKRIKITKKIKIPRTNKQLTQLKELTVKKMLSFILQPFVKFFEGLREKRKMKKLKKIDFERKEKERLLKAEEKSLFQLKENELKEEVRIARTLGQDLKLFLRSEQALIRKEIKQKRTRFLESIKLDKRIEAYRKREIKHIQDAERASLREERAEYNSVLQRIEQIKLKYKQIRESKVKKRIEALGISVSPFETIEDLRKKEKEYAEQRQKVELVLESFFRSAQSLIFQLNKRWISRHSEIIRVIDKRYEENLFYIRYDSDNEDNWLMLIYLEDTNPDKETIVVEDKTDEKYITKTFNTNSVFAYSDWMVDRWVNHLARVRDRQKKAS